MEADVVLMTFLSTPGDMVARGWDNFTARPQGPASFRFMVQPLVGLVLAIRAGLKDAKAGRPAFLWAALTDPAARGVLLSSSWKDVRTPFFVATTIDAIYQTIVHQAIYLFELLFTATLLGVVPYALLRGPANRIARLRLRDRRER
jgi:hypothetical protein